MKEESFIPAGSNFLLEIFEYFIEEQHEFIELCVSKSKNLL